MKSQDLSMIEHSPFTLNNKGNKLDVGCLGSSKIINSVNVLLQGEWDNIRPQTRNTLLNVIDMETGDLIGKDIFWKFMSNL